MKPTQNFAKPLVLDGGMATSLEKNGLDLTGALWSARILIEQPLAIADVHAAHIAAGADIITTASYQVSAAGLAMAGYSPDLEPILIKSSLEIAKEVADAADRRVMVAASVGPYGATLADGSEYRGDYQISRKELFDFHARRLEHFYRAEPDLLAFETIPSRVEIEVIAELLNESFTDIPAWISVSARNGAEISDGTPINEAFAGISAANLLSIGINCTKPEHFTELLQNLETDLPKIAYPNAGRTWDANQRVWLDAGMETIPQSVMQTWLDAGAKIIGGCCGLAEDQIAAVRELVK